MIGQRRPSLVRPLLVAGLLGFGGYYLKQRTDAHTTEQVLRAQAEIELQKAQLPLIQKREEEERLEKKFSTQENEIYALLKGNDFKAAETLYNACKADNCLPAVLLAKIELAIPREKTRAKQDSIEQVRERSREDSIARAEKRAEVLAHAAADSIARVETRQEVQRDSLGVRMQRAYDAGRLTTVKAIYVEYKKLNPNSYDLKSWEDRIRDSGVDLDEESLASRVNTVKNYADLPGLARQYLQKYPRGPHVKEVADKFFKQREDWVVNGLLFRPDAGTFNDAKVYVEDLAAARKSGILIKGYGGALRQTLTGLLEEGHWVRYEQEEFSSKLVHTPVRMRTVGRNFSEELDSLREKNIKEKTHGIIIAAVDDYYLVRFPGKHFSWGTKETLYFYSGSVGGGSYAGAVTTGKTGVIEMLLRYGSDVAPFVPWEIEHAEKLTPAQRSLALQTSAALKSALKGN